jgi:hypothetical protein
LAVAQATAVDVALRRRTPAIATARRRADLDVLAALEADDAVPAGVAALAGQTLVGAAPAAIDVALAQILDLVSALLLVAGARVDGAQRRRRHAVARGVAALAGRAAVAEVVAAAVEVRLAAVDGQVAAARGHTHVAVAEAALAVRATVAGLAVRAQRAVATAIDATLAGRPFAVEARVGDTPADVGLGAEA